MTTQGQVFLANGPVTGPGAVVASAGTLYLASPSNTYSGGTQVLSGNLNATNPGALGSGPVALEGNGTLSVQTSGSFPNALSLGSSASPTLRVQPSDVSGVTWIGPVQVTRSARIEASNFVITGLLTGGGVLTFQSTGLWFENNVPLPIELANPNNSYTGGTINASGGGPGAAVLADYNGSFGAGPITIQGGGTNTNAGVVALASGVTLANAIDAPGGLLLSNGDASVTGPITGTGIGLGAGTDGATLTVAGTLGGSADSYGRGLYVYGSWVVSVGTGTVLLDLASPATYAGQTGIVSATLDLGVQPNPLPPSTQVAFMNPGSLSTPSVLAVHANAQIGGLDGCIYPSLITIDHGAILTIALGNPGDLGSVLHGIDYGRWGTHVHRRRRECLSGHVRGRGLCGWRLQLCLRRAHADRGESRHAPDRARARRYGIRHRLERLDPEFGRSRSPQAADARSRSRERRGPARRRRRNDRPLSGPRDDARRRGRLAHSERGNEAPSRLCGA